MKIIDPSAMIIEDELAGLSIYQRIDRCSSVCYQRNPKSTEEEAQAFCRSMVERGHGMTMEMAVVHIVVPAGGMRAKARESKYLTVSDLNVMKGIITGSIRAFREHEYLMSTEVGELLACEYPLFFGDIAIEHLDNRCRFAEPHEIPWHHQHVAAQFIVNRAVSHELVRHRPCAILQESQRYCRYGDEVTFIRPEWIDERHVGNQVTYASDAWEASMIDAARRYKGLLRDGLKPQQARAVLPNSTKTELIVYASLPEWQHIFNLRCSPAADPEMRRVMIPLRDEFKQKYPEGLYENFRAC